jgi:hypothetical protein
LKQFVSPDDEHDVLEICRVKNKNKFIEKNCASRWAFTKKHYMMHGQQNVKRTHIMFHSHTLALCSGLNFKTNFEPRTIKEYILIYG